MSATNGPTADFELIQRVLREIRDKGRSASLEAWAVQPQQQVAAFREANGLKVKKECDAAELGLQRSRELIDLLCTAAIKQS